MAFLLSSNGAEKLLDVVGGLLPEPTAYKLVLVSSSIAADDSTATVSGNEITGSGDYTSGGIAFTPPSATTGSGGASTQNNVVSIADSGSGFSWTAEAIFATIDGNSEFLYYANTSGSVGASTSYNWNIAINLQSTGGGGGSYSKVVDSGLSTYTPLGTSTSTFYADDTAMSTDGWTVLTVIGSADEGVYDVGAVLPSAFKTQNNAIGHFYSTNSFLVHTNPGIQIGGSNDSIPFFNSISGGSYTGDTSAGRLFTFAHQDGRINRAGYQTATISGKDWLVVRCDQNLDFNDTTDGVVVEYRFSEDGEFITVVGAVVGTPTNALTDGETGIYEPNNTTAVDAYGLTGSDWFSGITNSGNRAEGIILD